MPSISIGKRIKSPRTWIFLYDLAIAAALAVLLWLYFRPTDDSWSLQRALPDQLEGLIAASIWIGALGGVVISFKGVYEHGADDWLNRYNLWHVGRPVSGAIAGGITYLMLLVVNKDSTPSMPAVLVAAFVLGTQEKRFFNFLYEVAGLIVRVPDEDLEGAVQVASIEPATGPVGTKVTITGAGFAPKATARLGGVLLESLVVSADGKSITGIVPAGTGKVDLTVANPDGPAWVKANAFEYGPAIPVLDALDPATTAHGAAADLAVKLTGSQFMTGAIAKLNSTNLQTTFVSSTELTATIPSADLNKAKTFKISVINPDPGGGTSGELAFVVS